MIIVIVIIIISSSSSSSIRIMIMCFYYSSYYYYYCSHGLKPRARRLLGAMAKGRASLQHLQAFLKSGGTTCLTLLV